MSITVTSDEARALAMFQRLTETTANPRQALSRSAVTLRTLVQQTFNDQRDPWGQPWKPHAFSTAAARDRIGGGSLVLVDTGHMRDTVEATADSDGLSVTVGTPYASFHQFGNPGHRAWGGPVVPLAQRPFLPARTPGTTDVPASWWHELLLPIEAALAKAGAE